MSENRYNAVAAMFFAVLAALEARAQTAWFQGLGHRPDASPPTSYVAAISGDGLTAVGFSPAGQTSPGFRWTAATGMVDFDNPEFNPSAVSYDGSVVVGSAGEAARWTAATGVVGQGFPPSGFTRSSGFSAVSADGQIAPGSAAHHRALDHCMIWDIPYDLLRTRAFVQLNPQGPLQLLEPLPGYNSSSAVAVSSDGSIIVGNSVFRETCDGPYMQQACIWTVEGGAIGLGLGSWANAISGDGSTVVGTFQSSAFRWTEGEGIVDLGDLPGSWANDFAFAASHDGSVIVGSAQRQNENAALIWDNVAGIRRLSDVLTTEFGLDLGTWALWDAVGISADGRTIVGNGINPAGQHEAWIAFLGDSPSPCLGDVNGDSTVNLSDLATLLAHFGMPSGAVHADGDLDADGDVDLSDLTLLLSNYGAACP